MQGAGSRLKFATPCYAGDAVTLHMSVRAWPGFEGRMVSIRASGTAENQEGDTVRHALTLDESTIDVPARVGDEGMVVVTIEVDGSVPPRGNHDRRAFCLELVSIGYDPIDRSLPGRDDIEKSATQGMNAELGEHRAVVRKTL